MSRYVDYPATLLVRPRYAREMRRTSSGEASVFIAFVADMGLFSLLVFSLAQICTKCIGEAPFTLFLFQRSCRLYRRGFLFLPLSAHRHLFSMLLWLLGLLPLGGRYAMFPAVIRRRSSVVERALGKGEVGCSIHPGGTT